MKAMAMYAESDVMYYLIARVDGGGEGGGVVCTQRRTT
jgi:hypothetical protein